MPSGVNKFFYLAALVSTSQYLLDEPYLLANNLG